jgi:hypothetical protein
MGLAALVSALGLGREHMERQVDVRARRHAEVRLAAEQENRQQVMDPVVLALRRVAAERDDLAAQNARLRRRLRNEVYRVPEAGPYDSTSYGPARRPEGLGPAAARVVSGLGHLLSPWNWGRGPG